MLSALNIVFFTVSALEMRKREPYRKQARSNLSVLLTKVAAWKYDGFIRVSLYTVSLFYVNTLA